MNDEPKAKPEDAEKETSEAETGAAATAESAESPDGAEAPAAEADDNAASDGDDPAPEAEAAAEAEPAKSESDLVAELQDQVADLKDRLLRAAAEMENARRRYEREMADTRQYAVTGFAREVLSIGDNLSRALAAVPEEARGDAAMKGLVEGVEMTERELLRVLDKHGVKRIEPHGKKFDPHLHQAMFEVEHDEAPHGTVVQVIQPGYSIGERILRPALVGVAKATAAKKSEKAEDNEDKSEASESAETEAPQNKAANDS
jgi:molecular chaperone GrpE